MRVVPGYYTGQASSAHLQRRETISRSWSGAHALEGVDVVLVLAFLPFPLWAHVLTRPFKVGRLIQPHRL